MSNAGKWTREALSWSGVLIVVAVAFPVLAVLAVVVRALVLPALIVAVLAGAVVYCANNRFRCWAYRVIHGDVHHHPAT